MPPTKKGHTNKSGVSRQTADGVFYVDGRYLCRRLENGTPCNREMAGTSHSITSHNSDFHAAGSYRRQMVQGDFRCKEDDCTHQSPTFPAILAHIRRRHAFKGSSDHLKRHYGIPIYRKRKQEKAKERNRNKKDNREESRHEVGNTVAAENPLPPSDYPLSPLEPAAADDDAIVPPSLFFSSSVHDDGDSEHTAEDDDDEGHDCIDPLLLEWDKRNDGSGNGRFGDGGSGLGGQILSSNVINASS
ncbi:hypothetical protein E0Z10_g4910 [Xylaria hypoxylon]|uniref:Uncharacterized protein n=1 Tax=Xylaria hypoxylon TaxID=37992 RepID=A0A4Z0YXH3_9PEZI|nr:hypothetical protein E0Z10_g4910 [Xylaria hypoxylon]